MRPDTAGAMDWRAGESDERPGMPRFTFGSPKTNKPGSRIWRYQVVERIMSSEGTYIRNLQDLHRDSIPGRWERNTLGKAPHKPLLLLCVTDLYLENSSRENTIEPTLYFEESFDEYWRLLFGSDNTSTFALPFFHLQHDGFWFLVGANGANIRDPEIAKTSTALRKAIAYAKLDPQLHELLQRAEWTYHLRSVIISANFEPEIHSRFICR
jgi:putative restriction endonuclease